MKGFLTIFLLFGLMSAHGQAPGESGFGKPALVSTAGLEGFDSLPEDRKLLLNAALDVGREHGWLRYVVGSGDPALGGFDCSGAMWHAMRRAKLDPPRSSGGQFKWLQEHKRFHEVPREATGIDHPALAMLRPGDLMFWGHPGRDGEAPTVNHVAMFLGFEKKDGLPVMINSTDGRSYRGVRANGYGVYDFRLPKADSGKVFLGYGTPPGIASE